MQFEINEDGDYSIISFSGDVDLSQSPKAREEILKQLGNGRHVMVDLSGVTYMDSSGVASLVEGFQTAKKKELNFGLVSVSPSVMSVLQLARLDKVFPIYENSEEMLQSGG